MMKLDIKDFIEQAKAENGDIDFDKLNDSVNESINKQANDLIVKKTADAQKNAIGELLKEKGLNSADELNQLFATKKEYEETQKSLEDYKKQIDSLSAEKSQLANRTKLLQRGYGFNDPDELDFVQLKVDKRLKDSDKDFDTIVSEISEEMPPQKLSKYSTPRNKGSEKTEQSSGFDDYFKKKYNK